MFERLKEELDSIFERDPAARNYWDLLTNYPGVHAMLVYRLSHRLWLSNWKWLARFLTNIARWLTGIEIHPAATIGRRCFIDHGMGVVIGETAEIGDDCVLYHGVTLGGSSWKKGKRHPTLQNKVVVGAGAKILGPITIGNGARIGCNSVVVKSVRAQATIIGIPGREMIDAPHVDPAKRSSMADRMGFDAYGVVENTRDPVAHALNSMLDHLHALEERIITLEKENSAKQDKS